MNVKLKKSICLHRGLGKENTTAAIKAAIDNGPFMVEFDIQDIHANFYLGHPPDINYDSTLEDELALYKGTNTIPKVDVKCNAEWKKDIELLLNKLEKCKLKVLVNIGGEILSPTEFMKAETYFAKNSNHNHLLNVDIARYTGLDKSHIEAHLNSLSEKLFSMSPKLEGDYDKDIDIARECGIKRIHFWSNNTTTYNEKQLVELLNKYTKAGFSVLFDISPKIVVPNS